MEKMVKNEMTKDQEIKKLKHLQKKQNRKTLAKAAGLKSILVADDRIVLTSYGKGNDTVIEKTVKDKMMKSIKDPKTYDARIVESNGIDKVSVDGRLVKNGMSDLPKEARKDQLGAKDILEGIFFGRTFPNDNIRIQLIYNALDIKKEYSRHVTNAVYGVNHLNRNVHSEEDNARQNDYIGMLFSNDTIEMIRENDKKQKEKKEVPKNGTKYDRFHDYYQGEVDQKTEKRKGGARPYLIYYEEAFEKAISELQSPKPNFHIAEKEVYERLCILSLFRQSVVHGKIGDKTDVILTPNTVLDDPKHKRLRGVLEHHYRKRVKGIDDSFIKNNKTRNLPILFDLYNATTEEEKKKLTVEYYNFIVLKENRNMGFSLKKLREILLNSPNFMFMKDQEFDTVRHKLYSVVDFVIYRHYVEKQKKQCNENEPDVVERLRATTSEEAKEEIYIAEAKRLGNEMKSILTPTRMDKLKGDAIKSITRDDEVKDSWIDGAKISGQMPSDFTLLANFLTMFLDGKEINEFLSILINKLESIAALYSVSIDETLSPRKKEKAEKKVRVKGFAALQSAVKEQQGIPEYGLKKKFEWIEKAGQIAREIRILKNVARMDFVNDLKFKKPIYQDAVNVLSSNLTDAETVQKVEDMLSNKDDKNLRNFISNNVIKSRRFKYLMRYANPTVVRTLMQDEYMIRFVLGRIDKHNKEQLEKYMNSIGEKGENRVGILTNKLLELRFDELSDVKQKVSTGSREAIKKEKYKALLGLYLTVAYIAIKNLVNVNSRYAMAFSALERDCCLFDVSLGKYMENGIDLVDKKISNGDINKRYARIFAENKKNFVSGAFNTYRNKVAHLSVIEATPKYLGEDKKREITSYFELFHFVVQNLAQYGYEVSGTELSEMIERGKKYHSYSKDALNVLNTPFGYSLSRYKALTIEPLFDKNYPEERLKEIGGQ